MVSSLPGYFGRLLASLDFYVMLVNFVLLCVIVISYFAAKRIQWKSQVEVDDFSNDADAMLVDALAASSSSKANGSSSQLRGSEKRGGRQRKHR